MVLLKSNKYLSLWWVKIILLPIFYFALVAIFESLPTIDNYQFNNVFQTLYHLLAIIFSTVIINYISIEKSISSYGLKFDNFTLKSTIQVSIITLISFLFILLLKSLFSNKFVINLNFNPDFVSIFLFIIFQSAIEEFYFRGLIFQELIERFSPFFVSITLSLIFSFAHYENPNISNISLLNIFLAGVLFSALFIQTKSIYPGIAFHILWNFSTAFIVDSNVSGHNMNISIFEINSSENYFQNIIFGGNFGIEEGLLAGILLLIFIFLTFKYLKPSPYLMSKYYREKYLISNFLHNE